LTLEEIGEKFGDKVEVTLDEVDEKGPVSVESENASAAPEKVTAEVKESV